MKFFIIIFLTLYVSCSGTSISDSKRLEFRSYSYRIDNGPKYNETRSNLDFIKIGNEMLFNISLDTWKGFSCDLERVAKKTSTNIFQYDGEDGCIIKFLIEDEDTKILEGSFCKEHCGMNASVSEDHFKKDMRNTKSNKTSLKKASVENFLKKRGVDTSGANLIYGR